MTWETLKPFRTLRRGDSEHSGIHRQKGFLYHGGCKQASVWSDGVGSTSGCTQQFIPEKNHKATLLCSTSKSWKQQEKTSKQNKTKRCTSIWKQDFRELQLESTGFLFLHAQCRTQYCSLTYTLKIAKTKTPVFYVDI